MLLKAITGVVTSYFIYTYVINSDFSPVKYEASDLPDYSKYLTSKDSLAHAKVLRHSQLEYPEDLEVDEQGNVYVGLVDGRIIRITPDDQWSQVGKATGWVLKIVHSGNKLTFIDIKVGICEIDLHTKKINVIVPKPSWVKFLNSFVIATDGKIYFTDTSYKYDENNYYMDFFQGKPHGSVYVWDPNTKLVSLLLDNLYYANGVEISRDQSTLYIAETYRYRIIRYYLSGDKVGTFDYLIENLAGFPDNLHFNERQQLWVAIPVFRDELMNFGDRNAPIVKRLLSYLPRPLWKYLSGAPYAGGFKLNPKTGEILQVLRGDTSRLHCITTIVEKNGKIYLGSIINNAIGVVSTKDI